MTNLGSETARGATVYVELRKPGTDFTWDQSQEPPVPLGPGTEPHRRILRPARQGGQAIPVLVAARGRNFRSEEAISSALL